MRQRARQPADKDIREVDQPLGDPPAIHDVAGQDKEWDGEQTKTVEPCHRLLRDDIGRGRHRKIDRKSREGRQSNREGDRHTQRQKDEEDQKDEEGSEEEEEADLEGGEDLAELYRAGVYMRRQLSPYDRIRASRQLR